VIRPTGSMAAGEAVSIAARPPSSRRETYYVFPKLRWTLIRSSRFKNINGKLDAEGRGAHAEDCGSPPRPLASSAGNVTLMFFVHYNATFGYCST